MRNVNFQFQLDNNPYFVTSGDDEELSFKLENLTVGNHVFKISLSREAWDYGFRFQDFEISIVVKPIPVILIVDPESFDLMVDDEEDINAKLYVYRNEEIGDELDPDEVGNITLTSSNSSIVTVDDEGNVVAVGEGKTVIIVGYPGNDIYAAAEDVAVEVTVSKYDTEITLEEDSFDLMVDDEDTIEAKLYVSDNNGIGDELDPDEVGNLTFTSSDESVVIVDSEGNFIAVGEGEAAITVSFAGNRKYKASSDTVTFTVSRYDTEISVEDSYYELIVDDNDVIVAELDPDVGDITFTSSDESVVTVDSQGNIKAVGGGRTGIIVSFSGDYKYKPSRVVVTVSVSKFDTSIGIDEYFLDMYVGDDDAIVAELDPEEAGELTFTSSDESVVTVDSEGNVVAVGEGEAIITVSFDGDYKYNAAEDATVTVNVSKIDTTIGIDEDSLELFVGDEVSVVAELDPVGAGNVTFVSSDESVVTVDSEGNVVAVGEGEANITISFDGDYKYNAADDVTVTVSVSKIDTSIGVNDELELFVGDEDIIVAELTPSDAGNLTFTSSEESVVTVDEDGSVVAVGEGEANITVSFDGDDKYVASEAIITVTVSKVDTIISVKKDSLDMFVGDENIIIANLDPEEAGNLTFTSSDESVVTVDDEGNVKAVSEGETIITVSFAGDDKYATSEAIVYVTVSMIDTRIDIRSDDSFDMFVGDEDNITAFVVADYGSGMIPVIHLKSLEYASSDDSVVTVDGEVNVKAVGEGVAVITVSFAGDGRYAAAEDKIIPVTVSLRDTSIDAKPKSLDLYVGEDDKIYYFSIPEDLDIKLNSSDESIVTVEIVDDYVVVTTVGDDAEYVLNSATVYVTVSKIPTEIIVDDSLTLDVGDVTIIDLTTNPGYLDVTYESSDPSVVIVDEHGIITAVSSTHALQMNLELLN